MSEDAPVIDGYRHVAFLGSGGFGDVHHYQLDRVNASVAIKVLRPGRLAHGGTEQLLHEAQALGRLSNGGPHPNIVTVQNVGTTSDGRPFLVMEYCPNGSWANRIDTGRIEPSAVLSVGVQIAGALHLAHQREIVHRDIKPGNILFGMMSLPKLGDFGIAALTSDEVRRGSAWLSRDYAAPEVVESREADEMSDLFSLAATLYHALAGRSWVRVPGDDNTPEALEDRILAGRIPEITGSGIPDKLRALIAGAMHRDVRKRRGVVDSARQFAERLQDIQIEEGYSPTPIPIDERGWTAPAQAEQAYLTELPGPPASDRREQIQVRGDAQATFDSDLLMGWDRPIAGSTAMAPPAHHADTAAEEAPGTVLPPPRRNRRMLLIAAGVLAAVAAVVAVNLFVDAPGGTPETRASHLTQEEDAVPDRAALPVPVITGKRTDAGTVAFEWTYSTQEAGDRFNVQRAGQAKTELVDTPKWSVAADPGVAVCIRVSLIREGQVGLPSEQVCG